MDMRQTLRPALQTHLTPQLIGLMQLLARPCQELRKDVLEALDANPALEEIQEGQGATPTVSETFLATAGLGGSGPAPAGPPSDELRLLEHLEADGSWRSSGLELEADHDDHRPRELRAAGPTGLTDHLLVQLREEVDDRRHRAIGEWIIGNLDEQGFLDEDVPTMATQLAVEPEVVASVLRRIQTFDPVGVGARDARHCLLLQARARFPDRPHLVGLIEHHLPALKARQYPAIARALGVTVQDVLEAEQRLLELNPRPARGFGTDPPAYVVPDVYIIRDGRDLRVQVNDAGLPRLRVSPYCRQILRKGSEASPEELAFVRARVSAAKWFIHSLYARQDTIRKVTEAIVHRQREFFDRGPAYLRPMVLRDVADDIGMSESTVSRVTSRKYADTPQGVLELKSFFGGRLPTAAGEDVAVESVKRLLRQMLAREEPRHPLSDAQIGARLRQEHGVVIARRTVAKYREGLGIASSSARRRRLGPA